MKLEEIAKVCYEVNNAYCIAIGDYTNPMYSRLTDEEKDSLSLGVERNLMTNLSPEESHDIWMRNKLESGWQYGKEKDREKKTHPCLVAYEDLPRAQRAKDYIFVSLVRSLARFYEMEKQDERI